MNADVEEREWWVFRVLRFQDRKPQGVAYVPATSLEEARANLKRNASSEQCTEDWPLQETRVCSRDAVKRACLRDWEPEPFSGSLRLVVEYPVGLPKTPADFVRMAATWSAKQDAVEAFRRAAWLKLTPPFDGRIFDGFLDD